MIDPPLPHRKTLPLPIKQITSKLHNDIPLWIKIPYTLLAAIILPVYWYKYGVTNFLWFSDIAFFVMVYALWAQNRLAASMMAIGVLPLETLWMISFFTGGDFLGMANYMFDPALPLWLRGLSLFHFPLPAVVIYMIWRFGYDARALYPQIILSLGVIALTHLLTAQSDNVNIIYPPQGLQDIVPLHIYLWGMPVVLIICVIIPMHFLLRKIATKSYASGL
jgi:hypothetical protein